MKRTAAIATTLLLAGCFFKSPAEGLTFRPPAGWMATPPFNGTQTWLHVKAGAGESLVLSRFGRVLNLENGMRVTRIPRTIPLLNVGAQTVLDRREMTLCGDQPSLYLETSMARNGTQPLLLEMVFSNAPGGAILSGYTRPSDRPPDPAAEAALYELCPQRELEP